MEEVQQTIFLVDDDAVFLKLLSIDFLLNTKYRIQTFSTGEECLLSLNQQPFLIILDYHLDGIVPHAMNGIETLDEIKAFNQKIPVIMLSSQDKIEVAVQCMHHKALDYLVKSETAFIKLQTVIQTIESINKIEKKLKWYMDRM